MWRHDQAQATAKYNHISKWNTSQVTDMSELFKYYEEFNDNISEWDVSNVTDMSYMFYGASSFNQDVSKWDVSKVTNMSYMFYNYGASSFNQYPPTAINMMAFSSSSFNQDVSEWDVSNVTDMSCMFCNASSFNQDVSEWDVSNVNDMSYMFSGASSFNQDVSGWNVCFHTDTSMMISETTVESMLMKVCDVSSFFEGAFKTMPGQERRQVFSPAFRWNRRKSFVLFLVSQRYLQYGVLSCNCQNNSDIFVVECDVLFDVEDLSRYICKFL